MSKESVSQAMQLYKNLVVTSANIGSIIDSIKSAFELDARSAVDWYKELSINSQHQGRQWIEYTLLDLLPKIAQVDKIAASEIFYNLLLPEFYEDKSLLPFDKPRKEPIRSAHDLWKANEKIVELFGIAPKEFLRAVIDLIMYYRNISKKPKVEGIQTDHSCIWYIDDDPIYEEIKLLKSIEREALGWIANSDPRLNEVMAALDEEPFAVAKRVKINILLVNTTKYYQELFKTVISSNFLSSLDLLDLLPKILKNTVQFLNKSEIEQMNQIMYTFPLPTDYYEKAKGPYRKYLISAIPEQYRTSELQNWLKNEGVNYDILHPQGEYDNVVTTFREVNETETKKQKFEDLNEAEQEKEISKLIQQEPHLVEKEEKIDLLKNINSYLYRNTKIDKNIAVKLEHIIRKYCNDPDPSGTKPEMSDENFHYSLVSYYTLRALAASCQLRITWHNTTEENVKLSIKMSEDPHSFVREEVCRNLRFLSLIDYQTTFEIAKKFLDDNRRVIFFLRDFLYFTVRKHTAEAFEICHTVIAKAGKSGPEVKDERSIILDHVVSLIIQMALIINDTKFYSLLEQLVSDESYNYDVKHTIAFTCKNDNILFDEKLSDKALKIYEKLIKSSSHKVRDNAEFFLLHTLTEKKKSFLPEITPLLETLSDAKYDLSSDTIFKLNIIEYLEAFWNEIPEQSAIYLSRIYLNNPSLVYKFYRTAAVVTLIEKLLTDSRISDDSKKNLMKTLMIFVKAGWPTAIALLRKLERKN